MSELEDLKVELIVSEPWEFGTIHGTGPFLATILKEHRDSNNPTNDSILLQLEKPLEFEDTKCEFFVASRRLSEDSIWDIGKGISVGCALTQITEERSNSSEWFDLSWWRGGVGLIADLSIAKETQ